MPRLTRLVAAVLLSAFAVSASAQALSGPAPPAAARTEVELQLAKMESVPQILAMARQFEKDEKWQNYQFAMQRVLELRPHAGNIKLELAAAYAMQEKLTETYDLLVKMQTAGYGYPLADDDRFALARGTGVWGYVQKGFETNAAPKGTGSVAFTLPARDLLIESITYDSKRKQFLAGSVRTGEVFLVDAKGATKPFIKPDKENLLFGVFDLAADNAHDVLWIASAAIPHVQHATADDYGRGGLWKFQLSTGKFLGRWIVPADDKAHVIATVAVNPAGQPFVADHASARIYTLVAGQLKLIVQNPKLISIRAIAPSADNKTLYFADHELGLFGLDLTTGRAFDIGSAQTVTLFGIESLAWYDGALVAVQNGIVPRRSVRFELSDDRRVVKRAQALDAAKPEFAAMTRGVVVGDDFYFVANSQKSAYDGSGKPRDAKALEGARIYRSDAATAKGSVAGAIAAENGVAKQSAPEIDTAESDAPKANPQ
jgi:hypothetical protein